MGQTGAITSAMGRLLWAIQAWYAEMENDERSQTIRAGLAKAKNKGKSLGRPRVIVDVTKIATLRASGASWSTVCKSLQVSKGTAQRAFASLPKNFTETATLSC
jgi:putative DNA-invertase from lambdoid prophage Rac